MLTADAIPSFTRHMQEIEPDNKSDLKFITQQAYTFFFFKGKKTGKKDEKEQKECCRHPSRFNLHANERGPLFYLTTL